MIYFEWRDTENQQLKNKFGEVVGKLSDLILCLFGFVKATKFRDSSEYSQCVQNVLAKSCLPCQIFVQPKNFWLSAERPRYEFSATVLRPVYTGDFCRGNSMQFLSRLSCNSKIARVNKVRFQCDLSPRYRTGFRTYLKLFVTTLARQKLHRVAATKIACVNGP